MHNFLPTVLVHCQLLLTCGQTGQVTNQKMEPDLSSATTQESHVSMMVKLPAKTVSGGSIKLTAALHNQSQEQLLVISPPINKLEVKILDSQGEEAPRTRYGKNYYRDVYVGSTTIKRLSPGESMVEVLELQRVFDLTLPDTYTLSVSRRVRLAGKAGKSFVLQIQKMSFEVSEPVP